MTKLNERDILCFAKRYFSSHPDDIIVGVGDDAFGFKVGENNLLITTDTTTDKIHADLRYFSASDFAWKAFTRCCSDLAGMGALPKYFLVSLLAPRDITLDFIKELFKGLKKAASSVGALIAGGDVSRASNLSLVISGVGLLERNEIPVTRSGAKPGDYLFLTNKVGGALTYLKNISNDRDILRFKSKFFKPRPRVREGIAARCAGASSMCDISDGLLIDLSNIAKLSKCSFELYPRFNVRSVSLEDSLVSGDEYELLFTAKDINNVISIFKKANLTVPILIGRAIKGNSEIFLDGKKLAPKGFTHTF